MTIVLFCLALCIVPHAPVAKANTPARLALSASHSLPYGGLVRQELAAQTARSLARLDVLRQAAPVLMGQKLVRIGLDTPLQRLALCSAVLSPLFAVQNDETNSQVRVQATLFTPVANLPDAISKAMNAAEELELRASALNESDELSRESKALLLRTHERREQQGAAADAPLVARLEYIATRLAVLDSYAELLTRFGSEWQPAEAAATALRSAERRDPDNPLLHLALAQTMLRLDRPHEALLAANEAVRLRPDMAAAYVARGMAHLRVGLSALAETDLSVALDLRHDKAGWWRARGASRFMQQEYAGMCSDLYQACGLGDCEGLFEMRERGLCPRSEPHRSPDM